VRVVVAFLHAQRGWRAPSASTGRRSASTASASPGSCRRWTPRRITKARCFAEGGRRRRPVSGGQVSTGARPSSAASERP